MKLLPLSQGKFAQVDDEDFEYLNQFKWSYNHGYAKRGIKINGKWTGIRLHQEIMKPVNGISIDHIDRDGLNNQRSNLRLCNQSQNNMNQCKQHKFTSSQFKGVSYHNGCKLWTSNINLDGKRYHLGTYKTQESAAISYNHMAKELYGKFARLNVVYDNQVERYLELYQNIMDNGLEIYPRGTTCKEIQDLQLVVNPDYPFMTFKNRKYDVGYFKKEMLWKLTADKYNTDIMKHAKMWEKVRNPDGSWNSNYGHYFWGQQNGMWKVVQELTRDKDSRKAIVPMLNNSHLSPETIDSVCTIAIGFRIRDNKLNCSVNMRSSDAIWGLATDIPTFSFLYRLVKGLLPFETETGYITITMMSSHIYDRHYDMVKNILKDPEYELFEMPYCDFSEAMTIVASRGDSKLLSKAGSLGRWLTE